jgi:hypothetical protein
LLLFSVPTHAELDETLVRVDVAHDIAKLFSNSKELELYDSEKGPILVADIYDFNNLSEFTPLLDRLETAGVKNNKKLLSAVQDIVRISKDKGSSLGDVPVPELSKYLCKEPLSGFSMYQGYKTLGDWTCKADDPLPSDHFVSFLGIYMNSTQAVLFQPLIGDRVDVWLAPFKSAPSDAITFTFLYQDDRWQICKVCSSSRL